MSHLLALLVTALAGCAPAEPAPAPTEAAPRDTVVDLSDIFEAFDARGTFVVLNTETGRFARHDPDRAATRFTPASTFKVYNALVALETGVVEPDLDSVQFEWDGTMRRIDSWNRDHSLRASMTNSTVWVYQEIARRLGHERYRQAFVAEPFGNGDTSCGLDTFWLESCLLISADEQVAFLDRLRRGEASFRPEVQAAVRELILLEDEPAYTLRGKTGWALRPGAGDIGWLVGWIERDGGAHVFALNVSGAGPSFDMMAARRGILFSILDRMGLRPARGTDPAPTAAPDDGDTGSTFVPEHPPADRWLARDKALHFGASFLLTLSAQYILEQKSDMDAGDALPVSAGFTLALGLSKEASDARRGPRPFFSWRDLAADALGVGLAVLVVLL